MNGERQPFFRDQLTQGVAAARGGWEVMRHKGPSQIQFWFIALAVGIAAGFAALLFRKGIGWLQSTLYGVDDPRMLHSFAEGLPWFLILVLPIIGGLVVGLILHWFTPDGRVRSVAEVIEGAALDDGRVEQKAGIASALASLITLSSGGSSGREGPVVHLAAVISSRVSDWIRADGITGRDLWAARWRRRSRPLSTRRSPGRFSRWRWCCAISRCMPSRRSSSPRSRAR